MTFKIKTTRKKAAVTLPDSIRLNGNFFVSPVAQKHPGSECIFELLSNDKNFLPFELTDGQVILLRKKNIVFVRVEKNGHPSEDPSICRITAQISFLSGETMEGTIFFHMPEGQSRLSDFFNSGRGFFPMKADNKSYFINPRYITMISSSTPE